MCKPTLSIRCFAYIRYTYKHAYWCVRNERCLNVSLFMYANVEVVSSFSRYRVKTAATYVSTGIVLSEPFSIRLPLDSTKLFLSFLYTRENWTMRHSNRSNRIQDLNPIHGQTQTQNVSYFSQLVSHIQQQQQRLQKQTHKSLAWPGSVYCFWTRYYVSSTCHAHTAEPTETNSKKYANIVWKAFSEHSTYSHQIEAELLAYIF